VGVISPIVAQERFASFLVGGEHIITQPSIVVIIRAVPDLSTQVYAGSLFHAQVQVSSQSAFGLLLSLL
jgi:hypothetical protein